MEVITERGEKTRLFTPLKPVGLENQKSTLLQETVIGSLAHI